MKHITKTRTTKSAGMRSCAPKELALSVLYIVTLRKWQFPVQNPENMERFIRLYWKHVCKQTILVSSFLSDKNNCKCRYTLCIDFYAESQGILHMQYTL